MSGCSSENVVRLNLFKEEDLKKKLGGKVAWLWFRGSYRGGYLWLASSAASSAAASYQYFTVPVCLIGGAMW